MAAVLVRPVSSAPAQIATEFARGRGCCRLTLETEVTNTGAQALYEGMGWERADDEYFYEYALT